MNMIQVAGCLQAVDCARTSNRHGGCVRHMPACGQWLYAVMLAGPLQWLAQEAAERHYRRMRAVLLRLDENPEDMLAFSGRAA